VRIPSGSRKPVCRFRTPGSISESSPIEVSFDELLKQSLEEGPVEPGEEPFLNQLKGRERVFAKQLVIATRGDGEIKPRSPLYQHFTRALSEMPKEEAGAGQISRASQSLPRKV